MERSIIRREKMWVTIVQLKWYRLIFRNYNMLYEIFHKQYKIIPYHPPWFIILTTLSLKYKQFSKCFQGVWYTGLTRMRPMTLVPRNEGKELEGFKNATWLRLTAFIVMKKKYDFSSCDFSFLQGSSCNWKLSFNSGPKHPQRELKSCTYRLFLTSKMKNKIHSVLDRWFS